MGIGGSKPLPGESFTCKEKVPIEKEYGILKHKASGNCIYGDGDNIYYNNECDIKDKKAKWKFITSLSSDEQNEPNAERTPEGYYLIQNEKSNKCIDADGGRVYFGGCAAGNDFMNWKPIKATDGHWILQHKASGKCIDSNGNDIYFGGCAEGNDFQNFDIPGNTSGVYRYDLKKGEKKALMRRYPNEAVADSWDTNWRKAITAGDDGKIPSSYTCALLKRDEPMNKNVKYKTLLGYEWKETGGGNCYDYRNKGYDKKNPGELCKRECDKIDNCVGYVDGWWGCCTKHGVLKNESMIDYKDGKFYVKNDYPSDFRFKNEKPIVFFTECGYEGDKYEFFIGEYEDLGKMSVPIGGKDGRRKLPKLESIEIPEGYTVRIYSLPNFKGANLLLGYDRRNPKYSLLELFKEHFAMGWGMQQAAMGMAMGMGQAMGQAIQRNEQNAESNRQAGININTETRGWEEFFTYDPTLATGEPFRFDFTLQKLRDLFNDETILENEKIVKFNDYFKDFYNEMKISQQGKNNLYYEMMNLVLNNNKILNLNVECLSDIDFDIPIQSIKIFKNQRYNRIETFEARKNYRKEIELYSECDYTGYKFSISLSDITNREPDKEFTINDLTAYGIKDNEINSIKIPNGLGIALYEKKNFTGSFVSISNDIPCLDSLNFLKEASSLKVWIRDKKIYETPGRIRHYQSGKCLNVEPALPSYWGFDNRPLAFSTDCDEFKIINGVKNNDSMLFKVVKINGQPRLVNGDKCLVLPTGSSNFGFGDCSVGVIVDLQKDKDGHYVYKINNNVYLDGDPNQSKTYTNGGTNDFTAWTPPL
jgi:hypothetical protein